MDDVGEELVESITGRISRMNQLFSGRTSLNLHGLITSRESVLDAFLVLFEECKAEYLSKNQYVTSFVNKYKDTVAELRKLRINIKDFEVKDTIGRGHFGEVQVVREKSSGDVYALKVLRKADTLAQQNVAFYEEERDILAKASSPWITHLQYAFQDKGNLYLVMEFHPGGDLLALLSRFDDVFEESMARFYLAEMVLAVHALHTMGYVHRDVKPENILIDRTGHIKLADFGSACKLADACSGSIGPISVANMPVGTPDYICPEVLLRMNSDSAYGKFGEECDWWSLGVCSYEMLYGKTPFTDENGSMVVTYANITSFKKCLKFPGEPVVSGSAVKLIRELLRDPDDRLKYEDIRVHEFFNEVNFDSIRHQKPPFIPVVMSNDDVSNFDEFEKARKQPRVDELQSKTQFSGQDLPFIGFTYTKPLPGSNERSMSVNGEISSPAAKGNLERRLATKTHEVVEMRERCKELEREKCALQTELDGMKRQMGKRTGFLDTVQAERDNLERDMATYISECNSLKRALELEKNERSSIDKRLMELMRDIEEERSRQIGLHNEDVMEKLVEAEETIAQMEEERLVFVEKIKTLERELYAEQQKVYKKDKMISTHQHHITQLRAKSQASIEEAETELEEVKRRNAQLQDQLRCDLDQALSSCSELTRTLSQVRQAKVAVEEELHNIKTSENKVHTLRSRLSDSEDKRRSLELTVHRLSLVERREEAVRQELTQKSQDVVHLAERVAELEGRLQTQQLEYNKCERLYVQRQDQLNNRIGELQTLVDTLTSERGSLEEQSLLAFEQNEDRLDQIKEQETTIVVLRSTVEQLEDQVARLRDDLQSSAARGHAARRARSVSVGQLASPCRLPSWVSPRRGSGKHSRQSGQSQTEEMSPVKCVSGATQTTEHYSPHVTSRWSNQAQTDSPSRPRHSNFTQTDNQTGFTTKKSFSGQTDTETKVRVSVSFGSPRKSGGILKKRDAFTSVNGLGQGDADNLGYVPEEDNRNVSPDFESSHDTMNEAMCGDTSDKNSWEESKQEPQRQDVIEEQPEEEDWEEQQSDEKKEDENDWEEEEKDNKDEDGDDDWDDEGDAGEEEENAEDDGRHGDGDEDNWEEEEEDTNDDYDDAAEQEDDWDEGTETEHQKDDGEKEDQSNKNKIDEKDAADNDDGKDDKIQDDETLCKTVHDSSTNASQELKRPIGKVEISSIFGPRVSGSSFGKRRSNNSLNGRKNSSDGTQSSRESSPRVKSSNNNRKSSSSFPKCESKGRFPRESVSTSERRVSAKNGQKQVPEESLDHMDKDELAQLIHDLQSEKKCLECQIKSMDREVAHLREISQQQRLRALDLKYELNEKTAGFDAQITQLKDKVDSAELAKSKAEETVNNLTELESTARHRAEALQQKYDKLQLESRSESRKLQEERDDLDMQVQALKNSLNRLENIEEELQKSASHCAKLEPRNKELECELNLALSEKNHFKMAAERSRDQLSEKNRQVDVLQQRHNNLKVVCTELEMQIQDLETLTSTYEHRQNEWHSRKNTYEKAVDERETEIKETEGELISEKQTRQRLEQKVSELKDHLRQEKQAHSSNVNMLRRQLGSETDKSRLLNKQMTEVEKENSLMDVEKKGLVRQLTALTEENTHLKEEISKHITANNELKSSNLRLSTELEEATDQYELLLGQKNDIENQMETEELNNRHDRFKLEQTLNQQTKLIDYLQAQVHQPPKKKKTIFGSRRADETFATSIQFRELQHSLEHEREKNAMLRTHITRLKEELNQLRSTSRNRGVASTYSAETPVSTPSGGQLSVPSTPAEYTSSMGTPKISSSSSRSKRERIQHNIPHRFITGLNSRAAKCVVCLGSVHFVKQAAKCQECEVICHPKCAPSLPAACGLPTEYMKYLADAQNKTRASVSSLQEPPLLQPHLTGILKVPRMGKQLWEKRWVVCDGQQLHFYADSESKTEVLEAFDLCPSNGRVTVHSAVTAAELTSTAQSDLPFILCIDAKSDTTCWPDRRLYLMAQNFSDKQKWVATLEAIIAIAGSGRLQPDAKMLGNTLAFLNGDHRLEVNCTTVINNKMALVGADEGLFMMDLTNRSLHQLVHVKGIAGIFQIAYVLSHDIVVMITGKERQVVVTDLKVIQQCAQCGTILPVRQVAEAAACTTFGVIKKGADAWLCAALSERLLLMKYDQQITTFMPHKEHLLSTVCSCMHFDESGIIVGTDRFYRLDLDTFTMTELLDKSDTSLSFAVYGAAHYDSFPIALMLVSSPGEPKEYLLCYHEFGIFVNGRGRRSRADDLKWAGLPLSFAFHNPYLYVAHFNSMEIIEILPSDSDASCGAKTLVNVSNPRYLGNALSAGAIYIGSLQETKTEIMCIRGNLTSQTEDKENRGSYHQSFPTRTNSQKSVTPSLREKHHPSSTSAFRSPPVIEQLERSPSRNPDYVTTNTEDDTASNTSSSDLTDITNKQTYTFHHRYAADYDSDSSV